MLSLEYPLAREIKIILILKCQNPIAFLLENMCTRRLLIEGGGDMPQEAARRFHEWAVISREESEGNINILILPWASELDPAEIIENFKLWGCGIFSTDSISLIIAPPKITMEEDGKAVDHFLEMLTTANAIFIAGGDQNRLCDLFEKRPVVKEGILAKYSSGIPTAGTSAGAAIMSKTMITGDGEFDVINHEKVGIREGLGFVINTVIDQHFVKRQRLNRLISVLLGPQSTEPYGLGIDEDVAVALVDGRMGEVLGPPNGRVVLLEKGADRDSFGMRVLSHGAKFELSRDV